MGVGVAITADEEGAGTNDDLRALKKKKQVQRESLVHLIVQFPVAIFFCCNGEYVTVKLTYL